MRGRATSSGGCRLAATVGAVVRDGGSTTPSPLVPHIKGHLSKSGNWAAFPNKALGVKLAARMLNLTIGGAAAVYDSGYADALQNRVVILNTGVLVVGVDEGETWSTVSSLLGQIMTLGQRVQPVVDRLAIKSVWDFLVPVASTGGVFLTSSAVIVRHLPGGPLPWTGVSLGIIVLTSLVQWRR